MKKFLVYLASGILGLFLFAAFLWVGNLLISEIGKLAHTYFGVEKFNQKLLLWIIIAWLVYLFFATAWSFMTYGYQIVKKMIGDEQAAATDDVIEMRMPLMTYFLEMERSSTRGELTGLAWVYAARSLSPEDREYISSRMETLENYLQSDVYGGNLRPPAPAGEFVWGEKKPSTVN